MWWKAATGCRSSQRVLNPWTDIDGNGRWPDLFDHLNYYGPGQQCTIVDLLTLGDASLQLWVSAGQRLEAAGTLVVEITGPENNAAVAARRLGAEVVWKSRLPDKPIGRRAASVLGSYDVNVRANWADEGRQGLTFCEKSALPRGTSRLTTVGVSLSKTATGRSSR